MKLATAALVAIGLNEAYFATRRFARRVELYRAAAARASQTGRILVVVGDPHSGLHTRLAPAYPCGDVCLDLTGCPRCPEAVARDLTRESASRIPSDRAVVFVSCVLEYVPDPQAAWTEILRMAGSEQNVFMATVEPQTVTAFLYPGARNLVLYERNGEGQMTMAHRPIPTWQKVAVGLGLAVLIVGALR